MTPGAEELGVIADTQGATPGKLGLITGAQCMGLYSQGFETMHVWDCTVNKSLKDLISTTYISNMHLLFGSSILGTSKLSMLDLEQH